MKVGDQASRVKQNYQEPRDHPITKQPASSRLGTWFSLLDNQDLLVSGYLTADELNNRRCHTTVWNRRAAARKSNRNMPIFKKEPEVNSQLEDHLANFESDEGQLSIDVYQQGSNLVIKSTIAGAKPEDIDITLAGDVLTIKGKREMDEYIDYNDYLYRECYWGKFSRTIILPFEIDESKVDVNLDKGVLTITLPKLEKRPGHKIMVMEND